MLCFILNSVILHELVVGGGLRQGADVTVSSDGLRLLLTIKLVITLTTLLASSAPSLDSSCQAATVSSNNRVEQSSSSFL